jgi:hypothetical protein
MPEQRGSRRPVGGRWFDQLILGVGFFSPVSTFVLVRTGNSSGIQISFFLALIALLLLMMQLLQGRRLLFRFIRADKALLFFTLVMVASVIAQFDRLSLSLLGLFLRNFLGSIVPTLLIYFVVRIGMRTPAQLQRMTRAMLMSAAAVCVFALVDFLLVMGFGMPHQLWFFNNPAYGEQAIGLRYIQRVFGLSSEPALFAPYLIALIPVAMCARRYWVTGLLSVTYLFSYSASGLLGLPVLIACILLSRAGRQVTVAIFARYVPVVVVIAVVSSLLSARWLFELASQLASQADRLAMVIAAIDGTALAELSADISVVRRFDSYQVGLALWSERPLLGHGWMLISPIVSLYQDVGALARGGADVGIHSALFSALAMTGIVGAVGLIAWAYWVAVPTWRCASRFPQYRALCWGWSSAFITMAFIFMLSSAQWPGVHYVPVIAAIAASWPPALAKQRQPIRAGNRCHFVPEPPDTRLVGYSGPRNLDNQNG